MARSASELLFDSEASLRLVDSAIVELKPSHELSESHTVTPRLPQQLLRAYGEIGAILTRLRESRGVLEQAHMDKLAHMHSKLREVTSATETAATDIMNGIDRSIAMVDELDQLGAGNEPTTRAAEVRGVMRDELFGLMNHLQFQDITTQQLAYASSVILEMEDRLTMLMKYFNPSQIGPEIVASARPLGLAFDPNASNSDSQDRQALADSLFTSH